MCVAKACLLVLSVALASAEAIPEEVAALQSDDECLGSKQRCELSAIQLRGQLSENALWGHVDLTAIDLTREDFTKLERAECASGWCIKNFTKLLKCIQKNMAASESCPQDPKSAEEIQQLCSDACLALKADTYTLCWIDSAFSDIVSQRIRDGPCKDNKEAYFARQKEMKETKLCLKQTAGAFDKQILQVFRVFLRKSYEKACKPISALQIGGDKASDIRERSAMLSEVITQDLDGISTAMLEIYAQGLERQQ